MKLMTLPLIFIIGCIIGFFLLFIADSLISKKRNSSINNKTTLLQNFNLRNYFNSVHKNILKTSVFMSLNGIGWLFAAIAGGLGIRTIQIMLMMSIALIISIVDFKIRIIPDEMILFLVLTSIVFILSGAIARSVLNNVFGFIIASAVFGILLLMRSNVGGGDIKYMAAMGFCLGYPDILKAMVIMSCVLLIWVLYLVISRKGGLKTEFAMGPFLSIGFVTTLLFQR